MNIGNVFHNLKYININHSLKRLCTRDREQWSKNVVEVPKLRTYIR